MTPLDPRLLRRVRAVRAFMIASVGVGVLTAGLIVAQAWLLAGAIGATVSGRTLDGLVGLLPWLALVFAARAVLSWAGNVLAQRSAAAVKSQLRREVVAARLGRPGTGGDDTASVIMTVTAGLDALDGYVARYLPQLVLAVMVPVVVGVAIWSEDPVSAVIIVVTLPLIPVFMILVGRLTEVRARRRWRTQARLAHHFADLVAGLPTLQVFGRASAQATGLDRSEDQHRRATVGTLRIAFLSSLVLELVAMLSVALVAVGVGLRTVDGALTLTTALFVLVLVPEAYRPLREVGVHYHDAADGLAAVDAAYRIIDAGTVSGDLRRSPGEVPDLTSSAVVLTGVAVRYAGSDRDAVPPTDLTWAPGEVLAVTGSSGSGKSTLVAALLRLVPVRTGLITVDGADVADLDPVSWRRRFAVVPQRPQLVSGTIADNVRLGSSAAPGMVVSALRSAGADALDPDRWLVASDDPLSAGELRRLALARALLRVTDGAQAMVLDEPTAGLDTDAEVTVIQTLRELGIAVLVITHRPAVLAAADRVVTLADLPAPLVGAAA